MDYEHARYDRFPHRRPEPRRRRSSHPHDHRDPYGHHDPYAHYRADDESGPRRDPRSFRRRHRHVFAWLIVGGGVLLLGLAVVALLQATGLMEPLQNAYFWAAAWVLPDAWEPGFEALPGAVHALIAVSGVALLAGLATEALEIFD